MSAPAGRSAGEPGARRGRIGGASVAAVRALLEPLRGMPDPLPLPPPPGAFDAAVTPPGSKSLTNRALLLAALSGGECTLRGALTDADDARVMIDALGAAGVRTRSEGDTVVARGAGGRLRVSAPVSLRLGNAGTATRFLAAAALLADAPVTLDGDARMRERPIGALIGSLGALGAGAAWLGREGFPPVRLTPPTPEALAAAPEELAVPSAESGQFVSALLLVAPFLPRGLRLTVAGGPTSPPYIEMTLRLLRRLGAQAEWSPDLREMRVAPLDLARPSPLRDGFELELEPDASGAGYFWAAAALTPGASCATPGVGSASLQGDARLVGVLSRMGARVDQRDDVTRVAWGGALRGVEADLSATPDAAMTIAVLACFAEGRTVLRGLRTLRVKETDRLEALRLELAKLGAAVEIIGLAGEEGLRIAPAASGVGSVAPAAVEFETYNDHRMAMALALSALRRPGVRLRGPACVAKTYPGFWRDFARLFGADPTRR